MLACLVVMAVGMYMAHAASGVTELTAWRFITGLGIGGMLAATNAVTAESTSKAGRSLSMAIYVIGYPLGGVIGRLRRRLGCYRSMTGRAVFLFGAVMTALMIPLVMIFVPETTAYLTAARPANALDRINRTLAAFGKKAISALPALVSIPKPKVSEILFQPAPFVLYRRCWPSGICSTRLPSTTS